MFDSKVWAVDNVEVDGALMRRVLQSASKRYNGIDGPNNLRVMELATPGAGVRISDGSGTIVGAEAQHQGTYFADNDGFHELDITPTGGTGRSDLVIVRAEDPTASSQWTQDPAVDGVVFPRVVEDVLDTQTDPPVNQSAIALARIDIPANTAVITDSMITDVRVVQQPRTQYFQDSIQHGDNKEAVGTGGIFTDWPDSATHVDVPPWARWMDVDCEIRTVGFDDNDTNPNQANNMWGRTRFTIDGTHVGEFSNYNNEWPTGKSHSPIGHAQTIDIVPYQGTNIELKFQLNVNKTGDEFMYAHRGTSVIWRVFFREAGRANP